MFGTFKEASKAAKELSMTHKTSIGIIGINGQFALKVQKKFKK
jgi:hypothetical protein